MAQRLMAVTDTDIVALRWEAAAAQDMEQVRECDRALAGSAAARRRVARLISDERVRSEPVRS